MIKPENTVVGDFKHLLTRTWVCDTMIVTFTVNPLVAISYNPPAKHMDVDSFT